MRKRIRLSQSDFSRSARFVSPSGVFQLAGRFFQYPSGVVVFFKESVALFTDLGTFFAQGRHSRLAFEYENLPMLPGFRQK